jgi:hypothetical protein
MYSRISLEMDKAQAQGTELRTAGDKTQGLDAIDDVCDTRGVPGWERY